MAVTGGAKGMGASIQVAVNSKIGSRVDISYARINACRLDEFILARQMSFHVSHDLPWC